MAANDGGDASREDEIPPVSGEDCVIPVRAPVEELGDYLLTRAPFDGAEAIGHYVEAQAPGEDVTYLERISEERVGPHLHETWDVHTSGDRYWVITNPTNLYSQRLFPSADYTLSFHVGLAARIAARPNATTSDEQRDLTVATWRRWEQAAEALGRANEAEDFQAVGMRCRECLLALARELASDEMVPPGADRPKTGDFVHWSELIANALASGESAARLRGYLRDIARASWQLVSWLTHATGATRYDAEIALDATQTVAAAFTYTRLRKERGGPSRCEACGSYRMESRFVPSDNASDGEWVPVCAACGRLTERSQ